MPETIRDDVFDLKALLCQEQEFHMVSQLFREARWCLELRSTFGSKRRASRLPK